MDLFRVIRRNGQTTIQFARHLTQIENTNCEDDLKLLHSFHRSRAIFPILVTNAEEVNRAAAALPTVMEPSDQQRRQVRMIGETINRGIVNFLTATRLYLDHTATRLDRSYGKSSEQMEAFTEGTSREFDTNGSYRILYKLRNYVQHCGLPVDTAGINSRLSDGPGSVAVHEVVVGARVQTLLSTYDSWGMAKADLVAIGETLKPQELVPDVMSCLQRIEKCVLRAELPVLLEAGRRLTGLLREVEQDNAVPALITVTDFTGGGTFQFHEPPYTVLELLRLVRLEPDGRPIFKRAEA
jgi:hypothetical protein